jgi:hypothetical protein
VDRGGKINKTRRQKNLSESGGLDILWIIDGNDPQVAEIDPQENTGRAKKTNEGKNGAGIFNRISTWKEGLKPFKKQRKKTK